VNIGTWAEDAALRHLKCQGLRLIVRNYRCRMGELDLVMSDGPILVIVEVRYRRPSAFGTGFDSVTPTKQRRLAKATQHFLLCHRRFSSWPCRFDVVSASQQNHRASLRWMKDAF
jgi:putative endonuclease